MTNPHPVILQQQKNIRRATLTHFSGCFRVYLEQRECSLCDLMAFIADDEAETAAIQEAYCKSGCFNRRGGVCLDAESFGEVLHKATRTERVIVNPFEFYYWCLHNGYADRLPNNLRLHINDHYEEWQRENTQQKIVEESGGALQPNMSLALAIAELEKLVGSEFPVMGSVNPHTRGSREEGSPQNCNGYNPAYSIPCNNAVAIEHTFSNEGLTAQYATLMRAELWTLKEALPLLLGFTAKALQFVLSAHYAPDTWGQITLLSQEEKQELHFFALRLSKKLNGLLAVAEDSHHAGSLTIAGNWNAFETRIAPGDFLAWARAKGYEVPQVFDGITAPQPTPLPVVPNIKEAQPTPVPRKQRKMSQIKAAAMAGVCVRTLQYWEAGERTPHKYPGREDVLGFTLWANNYKISKEALDNIANSGLMDTTHNTAGGGAHVTGGKSEVNRLLEKGKNQKKEPIVCKCGVVSEWEPVPSGGWRCLYCGAIAP